MTSDEAWTYGAVRYKARWRAGVCADDRRQRSGRKPDLTIQAVHDLVAGLDKSIPQLTKSKREGKGRAGVTKRMVTIV